MVYSKCKRCLLVRFSILPSLLNSNKLPCRCVLNGLEAEPVPLKQNNCEILSPNCTSASSSTKEETLLSLELYIIINGKVTKSKVLWRSTVDVSALRTALRTLKSVNVYYRNVSDASIEEATKSDVETVDSTTSCMLVKATKEDMEVLRKSQSALSTRSTVLDLTLNTSSCWM